MQKEPYAYVVEKYNGAECLSKKVHFDIGEAMSDSIEKVRWQKSALMHPLFNWYQLQQYQADAIRMVAHKIASTAESPAMTPIEKYRILLIKDELLELADSYANFE